MSLKTGALACALAVIVAPLSTAGPVAASGAVVTRPDPGNGSPENPNYIPGSFPDEEQEVIDLSNQERRKNGCQVVLREDDSLTTAARGQSQHMASTQTLSHDGEGNSQPDDRMKAAGYDTSKGWGENVAYGQDTPEEVMDSWMHSTPHRKNILNCKFKALGVGAARSVDGNIYWTQDFGGV